MEEIDAALEQGAAVVLHRIDRCRPELKDELAALLHVLEQPQLVLTAGVISDDLLPILSALRGIEVVMPPLRDRREEISALASHVLLNALGREVRLSPKLRDALVAADWPGNVGQLRELVESAASRCLGGELRLADLTAVQLRDSTLPASRVLKKRSCSRSERRSPRQVGIEYGLRRCWNRAITFYARSKPMK